MARRTPDPMIEARAALRAYWGATGKDRDGKVMRETLRSLGLRTSDCLALADEVPASATGPTGDRARDCVRFLERLAGGA